MSQKNRDYLDEVYTLALSLGIPEAQAQLAAAQSALETGYGKHAPGNAYFGMKAGSSWDGPTQTLRTHEEENGALVAIDDKFRVYDDKSASLADWYDRLKVRWPDAAAATTFDEAVNGLKIGEKGAYATDSKYKSKLANIVGGMTPRPPGNIPEVATSLDTGGGYTIRSGDTLGELAERFGTTVEALSQANGISDPNRIFAGQELRLPSTGRARPQTQQQPPATKSDSLLRFDGMPPRASYWQEAGEPPSTLTQITEADTRAEQRTLGGTPQGNVLGFRPLPAPGPLVPLEQAAVAPIPFPASALAPAAPQPRQRPGMPLSPAPEAAGFNLGGMLGNIGNTLGEKVQQVGTTLGNTAQNVVEGTGRALSETGDAAKDLLTNELLRTVGGRTLAFNTMMGIEPRRDRAADRRNSAPEGYAYGSTGNKLYKIGGLYNSRNGQVRFDGSKFVPVGGVKTALDVTPPGGSKRVGTTTTRTTGPNVVDEVGALRYHG
jgi:LysM repeat protein